MGSWIPSIVRWRLNIDLVIATKTEYADYAEKEDKNEEGDETALFLCLVKSFVTLRISAMPVREPLIILVAVLLLAVLVAHPLAAAAK